MAEQQGVQAAPDLGDGPVAERQRQNGDLAADDPIVGVAEKAERASPHQGRGVQGDDPRGPIGPQARHDPDAQGLKQPEDRQQRPVGNAAPGRGRDDGRQPGRVQEDEQRIMARARLTPVTSLAPPTPSTPCLIMPGTRCHGCGLS